MTRDFLRFIAPAVALEAMGWIFYCTGRLNADEFVTLLWLTFWYGVMAAGVAMIRKALHHNNYDPATPGSSMVPLGDAAGRLEGGKRPVDHAAGGATPAHLGASLHTVLDTVEGPARPAGGSPTLPLDVPTRPLRSGT
ncbi:hypothetical protein NONO_c59790 [Nocardia nova SH22a]|uniref:Uncharacterized protein n=1 Tax=Nocardia nova SH22a TaxID=1415166 RepID=W5TN22_9NOCA|nr:hypothetical protein [Nocardia nova]AHH20755.1 hypothetical protein NONO_c59790 [Nocardia nova SH22a]